MNIILGVLVLLILTIALLMAVVIVAYLQTLDISTSIGIVKLQIIGLFFPKIKYEAYQEAYKQNSREVLTAIVKAKDKELLKNNLELTLEDVKEVKEITTKLLKDKSYGITIEQSKDMLKDLGELDFFFSFQTMVEFYSNPKRQKSYNNIHALNNRKAIRFRNHKMKSSETKFYDSLINVPNIIDNIKKGNLSFN